MRKNKIHEVFLQIPGATSALEHLTSTALLPQLRQTGQGTNWVSSVSSLKVIHSYWDCAFIPVFPIKINLTKICAELHAISPAMNFCHFVEFRSSALFKVALACTC